MFLGKSITAELSENSEDENELTAEMEVKEASTEDEAVLFDESNEELEPGGRAPDMNKVESSTLQSKFIFVQYGKEQYVGEILRNNDSNADEPRTFYTNFMRRYFDKKNVWYFPKIDNF